MAATKIGASSGNALPSSRPRRCTVMVGARLPTSTTERWLGRATAPCESMTSRWTTSRSVGLHVAGQAPTVTGTVTSIVSGAVPAAATGSQCSSAPSPPQASTRQLTAT